MSVDDALDDQRELVDLVRDAGWDVTDVELSVYESPWEDGDAPEATVTLTVKRSYESPDDESDDDNPYRVN